MLHVFLAALLVVLASVASHRTATAQEVAAEKRADIKQLMDLTGSANIARQFSAATSQQMFQVLKAARPDISDRALTVMNRELDAFFADKFSAPGGMADQVVPLYDKYLTHDEIRELLAFYRTPLGKKTIQVMPQLVNESMAVGQRWGQSLVPEIEQRLSAALRREGLLKEP